MLLVIQSSSRGGPDGEVRINKRPRTKSKTKSETKAEVEVDTETETSDWFQVDTPSAHRSP